MGREGEESGLSMSWSDPQVGRLRRRDCRACGAVVAPSHFAMSIRSRQDPIRSTTI